METTCHCEQTNGLTEKYNKLVKVELHYFLMMIIIIMRSTFCFYIYIPHLCSQQFQLDHTVKKQTLFLKWKCSVMKRKQTHFNFPTNVVKENQNITHKYVHDNVNLYRTNAPSPLKSASYERTKKFKCPVHSCRGLEL
jgi:hypothetical protein